MEERRGESSDSWMKNAGNIMKSSDIVLMAEHKQRVNILGIDPDAVWIDQINRINELREGSPLTNEERERALAHHIKKRWWIS